MCCSQAMVKPAIHWTVREGVQGCCALGERQRHRGRCEPPPPPPPPPSGPPPPPLGLCRRPVRKGQGAVQCGTGHRIHLQCAGHTAAQAWKGLREKKEFQCKCTKAGVQKWLEETDKERRRRRQVKATTERRKGVRDQQEGKNTAGKRGSEGEEHQAREQSAGGPQTGQERTADTSGAAERQGQEWEEQPRETEMDTR